MLDQYPVAEPFGFRHIMWAMEAFDWFSANELDEDDLSEYGLDPENFAPLLTDLAD